MTVTPLISTTSCDQSNWYTSHDHDVATYLPRVNAMKREFLRFGAEK